MSEIDLEKLRLSEKELDQIFIGQERAHLISKFKERERKHPHTITPVKNIISDPLFHDTIKSLIDHYTPDVFSICKGIPTLKNSKLFKPESFWKYSTKRQEYLMQPKFRSLSQADVVWFFKPSRKLTTTDYLLSPDTQYHIIHEVKTGSYNIDEIYRKYYIGLDSQIWIWGWNRINNNTFPLKDGKAIKRYKTGFIKKLDIEYLLPLLKAKFPRGLLNNLNPEEEPPT